MTVETDIYQSGSPFDGAEASGYFFFGFGVIVFAYLVGFAVGQVRKPIRQGT